MDSPDQVVSDPDSDPEMGFRIEFQCPDTSIGRSFSRTTIS